MALSVNTYALPASVNMADVAGSADVIVAMPESRANGYYRSTDGGATWTSHTCPLSTQSPDALYWNGSYFLVVGNQQCAKSADGLSWTTGTLSGTEATFELAWNGSIWVAGRDDKISTSPDGLTWTDRALPLTGWHVIQDVIWDGARFCALAEDQNDPWGWFFWTSSDGLTWASTSALPTPGDSYCSLAYNGSVYVTANSSTGAAAYSADGVTWATTAPVDVWDLLGPLNGEIIAQDGALGFKTTTDGATWGATTPTVTGPAVVSWSRPRHARAGASGLYATGSGQFAYVVSVAPGQVSGFSSTAFGQVIAVYNQTAEATGFTGTVFGTPNAATGQLADATGFVSTALGEPGLGMGLAATGFTGTLLGEPTHTNANVATDTAPTTLFGTPSVPVVLALDATGAKTTLLGTPVALRFIAPILARTQVAQGYRKTRLGEPDAYTSGARAAAGFSSTAFGAPGSDALGWTLDASGREATAALGTPAASLRQSMTTAGRVTALGSPSAARAQPAGGFNRTRFGTTAADFNSTSVATGWVSSVVGTPACVQRHRVSMAAPSTRFGKALLRRTPTC